MHGSIDSGLSVGDEELDGDVDFTVDSVGFIKQPFISLSLDVKDEYVDISPDSGFFSESVFISNSFKMDNDSHGLNVDSVIVGIND